VQSRESWIHSQCKQDDKILAVGAANGWVWEGCNFPNLVLFDINEFPPGKFPRVVGDAHNLPFDDNSFDCCTLCEILEHVQNPILILREAARVARGKVVFTVPDEYHWTTDHLPFRTLASQVREEHLTPEQLYSKSNPTVKPNDLQQAFHNRWYTEQLLKSHLDFLNLPYTIQTIAYDGWSWFCGTISKEQIKLNIGSFVAMLPPPWINLDILDLIDYAKEKGFNFQQVDVTMGLPFGDKSVDHINCSHLIEHLAVNEGIAFLKECYRTLKLNGVVRICAPDTRKLVDAYTRGDMDRFNPDQPDEYKQAFSQSDKFWRILTAGHKTCYDTVSITHSLELAGFKAVNLVDFDEGVDYHPEVSLSVEGQKKKALEQDTLNRFSWTRIKIHELTKDIPDAKVVDIGCNECPITRQMNNVTWVDILSYEEIAKLIGENGNVCLVWNEETNEYDCVGKVFDPVVPIPRDRYVQADAQELPFADNEFDLAVATELLEHVENPVAALREVSRVAKWAIFTTPNEYNWAPEHLPFTNKEHVRLYTQEMLEEQLKEAGIEDYTLKEYDFSRWATFTVVVDARGLFKAKKEERKPLSAKAGSLLRQCL